jgi:hypothetical protein
MQTSQCKLREGLKSHALRVPAYSPTSTSIGIVNFIIVRML